jgi:hypothetical protein
MSQQRKKREFCRYKFTFCTHRYCIGILVCIKYGLFLELSLKRNGCGLLDLTVSGKNYLLKLMIKTFRRTPPPCPLLKQRKKDRPQPRGHNNNKIFLVQAQMPPVLTGSESTALRIKSSLQVTCRSSFSPQVKVLIPLITT